MPRRATSCMKNASMPRSRCQANSALPGQYPRSPIRTYRRGSTDPPSTSRYIGVPRENSTPKTSRAVSVCVSKWTSPSGPWTLAQARTSGSAIEWSPPRTMGTAPARATSRTVSSIAACERRASAGTTGASPKSTTRSSASGSAFASRCAPVPKLAARMARGPKRAPGRSETRSSEGAPTMATSTPASSAGSSV